MKLVKALRQQIKKTGRRYRLVYLFALPYAWLFLFWFLPFLIVVGISFSESVIAIPPYTALFSKAGEGIFVLKISLSNYLFLISQRLYALAYVNSLVLGFLTTLFCLVLAYPAAWGLLRLSPSWRFPCLALLVAPFWIAFLVRIYAWIGLLSEEGFLSQLLVSLGLLSQGQGLIGTSLGVLIGMVYTYLPFMILPLYTALEKIDFSLVEAAFDLGCRPFKVFWKIVLPLSKKGALTGAILVFIPAMGEFAIPELLGGKKVLMIGQAVWSEFFYNRDWPLASALAICMLVTLLPPILLLARLQKSTNTQD